MTAIKLDKINLWSEARLIASELLLAVVLWLVPKSHPEGRIIWQGIGKICSLLKFEMRRREFDGIKP